TNAAPAFQFKGGTAGPADNALGSPIPVTATLAANQSLSYMYTFTALAGTGNGPWTLDYGASGAGIDQNSGQALPLANTLSSNLINMVRPAPLVATITVVPGLRNVGQPVTVVATVLNNGGTAASAVAPSALTVVGSGGALLLNGPSPATSVIPPSTSVDFTFTYSSVGSGTLNFQ